MKKILKTIKLKLVIFYVKFFHKNNMVEIGNGRFYNKKMLKNEFIKYMNKINNEKTNS